MSVLSKLYAKLQTNISSFLNDHQVHTKNELDQVKLSNFFSNNEIVIADSLRIDLTNNTIEFLKPFEIISKHTITIKSDKHVILSTSGTPEPERTGYNYSVWLNPELNENNQPVKSEIFFDSNGYMVVMEAKYDEYGSLIVPEGYRLPHKHETLDKDNECQ